MNATELAKAFAEEMNDTLTTAEIDEVNRLNAAETNPNICHSHDFCDANEVMLAAMARFGVEFDTSNSLHELLDKAWGIAKGAEFNAEKIDSDEREIDQHFEK